MSLYDLFWNISVAVNQAHDYLILLRCMMNTKKNISLQF